MFLCSSLRCTPWSWRVAKVNFGREDYALVEGCPVTLNVVKGWVYVDLLLLENLVSLIRSLRRLRLHLLLDEDLDRRRIFWHAGLKPAYRHPEVAAPLSEIELCSRHFI